MYKLITILALITISVWISVFSITSDLQIIACDVGQGDAILIQKNTTQILIDGGPNQSVLNCLGRHIPFGDKQIEVVFLTHPDIDHYGGLIDVFKNYKISNFFTNGSVSSSQEYKVLENLVGGSGVHYDSLVSGRVVRVGMIYLDIVNPLGKSETLNSKFETNEDNDNSLVMLLTYQNFKAIFTGDAEQEVSDRLSENEKIKNLNYIKVNHHGSRNGMTEKLLKAVNPEVAVISSSPKNRYGHPHAEILKMLNESGVRILRTDQTGDIVIATDGINFWAKK